MNTVCPVTTPSVGVPTAWFEYPKPVIFTIGRWFTNENPTTPSGFAWLSSTVPIDRSPWNPGGAAVSWTVYRPSRRLTSRNLPPALSESGATLSVTLTHTGVIGSKVPVPLSKRTRIAPQLALSVDVDRAGNVYGVWAADDVKTDSSGNETKGSGCTVYLSESRDGADGCQRGLAE